MTSPPALVHTLARARAGDPVAMRALYDAHADRVYTTVYRLAGGDAALAQDWAQDAWLQVFRGLSGVRADAAFGAWVHRVAVNAALQGRRRLAHERARTEPLGDATPDVAAPGPGPDARATSARVEWALARLGAGMRAVLLLHDVDDYTHEEVAAVLGIAVGTSKSQLFKARARLRALLRAPQFGVDRAAAGAAGGGGSPARPAGHQRPERAEPRCGGRDDA